MLLTHDESLIYQPCKWCLAASPSIHSHLFQRHVLSESVIAWKAGLRQLCLWLLQAEEPETILSQASNSIAGSCAGGGTLATQQTSRGALNAAPSTFIIANCLCFQV